jgi:hypothetical protein
LKIFTNILKCLTSYSIYFLFVAQSFGQIIQTHSLPLKVAADKRHLADQQDRPFLYQADTGWMLFLKLTKGETIDYLVDRKVKRFNVIQTMLTGFDDFANRDGQYPFLNNEDFSQPNEAYFAHVDWVVRQADSLGQYWLLRLCGRAVAKKDGPERVNPLKKMVLKKLADLANI